MVLLAKQKDTIMAFISTYQLERTLESHENEKNYILNFVEDLDIKVKIILKGILSCGEIYFTVAWKENGSSSDETSILKGFINNKTMCACVDVTRFSSQIINCRLKLLNDEVDTDNRKDWE
jgi:hypothetical protein